MNILIFFLLSTPIHIDAARDTVYYTETGDAKFTSSVPLHTFSGESSHLTGMIDLEKNVVDFYLDLNTIETGIDRRDRDMQRTLETEEFPFAEFTGSFKSGFERDQTQKQTVVVDGEFTIHGKTLPVEVEGVIEIQGDDLVLEAEWSLFLDDYDIEPPGILFYRVDEEQKIQIKAVLSPQSEDEL